MWLLFECVGSYLKTLELSWLCADLQVSAELADSHRINKRCQVSGIRCQRVTYEKYSYAVFWWR